jgi:hypothetical protein
VVENGKFIGEVAVFLDWRKVIDGIGYFGLLRKRKWLGRGTCWQRHLVSNHCYSRIILCFNTNLFYFFDEF